MSTWEIGRLFGVSRPRVSQLVSRPDFPKPVAVLKTGRIWNGADVRQWAAERGRQVHPLD